MLPRFSHVRARSIDEALSALSGEGALVQAGGTDLLGCLRDDVLRAQKLVSISGLGALRGIREQDGALRIGALTTISELANNELVRKRFRGLAQAAAAVASPQLRNQGTIGGNLCQKPRCWYYRGEFHCLRKGGDTCFALGGENQFHCIFGGDACVIVHPSDTAPMLVALGARVRIAGPDGERELAVEELHVAPTEDPRREVALNAREIITEVVVPTPAAGLKTSYRKVRARQSWDFALSGLALALELDGNTVQQGSIVMSGVAPVPWRSRPAEQAITGKALGDGVIEQAARAAVKDAEPLSDNAYKVPLTRGIVEEELRALARG